MSIPGTEISALSRRRAVPLDTAHSTASSTLSNPFGRIAKIAAMLFNASIAVPSTTSMATSPTTLEANTLSAIEASLIATAAPIDHPTSTTSPNRCAKCFVYNASTSRSSVSIERSLSSSAVVAPCPRISGATTTKFDVRNGDDDDVVQTPSSSPPQSRDEESRASARGANVNPLYPAPWMHSMRSGRWVSSSSCPRSDSARVPSSQSNSCW